MKKRVFHINQFPQDRIFVLLNEKFHKHLFAKIHQQYSFEDLNKQFDNKLNHNTYKKWRYRMHKPKRSIPQFIHLWFVIKISEILSNHSIDIIEKQIIAYKGPSASSIIWNPNLPLFEDERLLKILAHLLGDGHAGGAFGTGLPKGKSHSEYRNFCTHLLDQFEKDIQIFGKVSITKSYDHGSCIFPNVIGYLIEHLYKVDTNTFDSEIPLDIYRLPKRIIASFIRSFFDDEAHVFDSSIEVYSANPLLLIGVINLFKQKFEKMEISQMKVNRKAGKNIKYSFSILSKSLLSYHSLIGFDHPQKEMDLQFNIKRITLRNDGNKDKLKQPKLFIRNLLKKRHLTAKQISREMFVRHSTVLHHLNKMKEKREVFIVKKGLHNENIWTLKSNRL